MDNFSKALIKVLEIKSRKTRMRILRQIPLWLAASRHYRMDAVDGYIFGIDNRN